MFMATHLVGFGGYTAGVGGNDSFTKLLLHCDGADASTTFSDASLSARGNATVNGNAQVDTAQSVFGGASALFDGTGDFLSYASSADWNLGAAGSGDLTVDFRVRFAVSPGANIFILVAGGNINAGSGWTIYYESSLLKVYDGTNTTLSWSPSADTWYHVAIVRSGSTLTGFVDGTSIGNFGSDKDFNNDSVALGIGGCPVGTTFGLNGWMDEVRISKGIARWTSNFTPPTGPYD
jgi:hypothetical protein